MMRLSLLSLLSLLLALLLSTASAQTQQVQWGYSLQCPPFTLDYPCLVTLSGTATVNSTVVSANVSSVTGSYQYYQMLSFTGTRTYYNRFGAVQSTPITSLAPVGEIGARNQLVLAAYALPAAIPAFRLGSAVQFPGGLLGSEVRLIVTTGYATESIALVGNSNTNSENSDPTTVQVCSTAPGLRRPPPMSPARRRLRFSAPWRPVRRDPTFGNVARLHCGPDCSSAFSSSPSPTLCLTECRSPLKSTLPSPPMGTVSYDSLGNLYYQLIAISGTRSEQSLLNVSAVTTVQISSLMAPNIIATSNIAYITNNNRIYPSVSLPRPLRYRIHRHLRPRHSHPT